MFYWAPVKKLILVEVYQGVRELETLNILDVPYNVVLEGGEDRTVPAVEKMEIQVK